jgi:hypothetical protein
VAGIPELGDSVDVEGSWLEVDEMDTDEEVDVRNVPMVEDEDSVSVLSSVVEIVVPSVARVVRVDVRDAVLG